MYGETDRKIKNINLNQTLTYEKKGKATEFLEMSLDFMGDDFEEFFKDLARSGFQYHIIAYFVNSEVDSYKKSVNMAGNFAFDQWMKRHAGRITQWTFKKSRKRRTLPHRSEDHDCLRYTINGRNINDFWDDYFVASNEDEDED